MGSATCRLASWHFVKQLSSLLKTKSISKQVSFFLFCCVALFPHRLLLWLITYRQLLSQGLPSSCLIEARKHLLKLYIPYIEVVRRGQGGLCFSQEPQVIKQTNNNKSTFNKCGMLPSSNHPEGSQRVSRTAQGNCVIAAEQSFSTRT